MYGIYALVNFFSLNHRQSRRHDNQECLLDCLWLNSLARCTRSFVLRKQITACVNPYTSALLVKKSIIRKLILYL